MEAHDLRVRRPTGGRLIQHAREHVSTRRVDHQASQALLPGPREDATRAIVHDTTDEIAGDAVASDDLDVAVELRHVEVRVGRPGARIGDEGDINGQLETGCDELDL